ncbi:hypothetical protein [Streptomyces fagopyri]
MPGRKRPKAAVDRMAFVRHPPTRRNPPAFGAVAKYYGTGVDVSRNSTAE